jgi:integrase
LASFKLTQSGEITPELREEYLKLARLGQTDVDAGFAAEALFDETLDSLLKARGIRPADGYHDYWEAIEAAGGGDVIANLNKLTGQTIDHLTEIESWLGISGLTRKTMDMYRSDVRAFIEAVGEEQPFEEQGVRDWYYHQLRSGVSPKTINRKLGAIKGYHGHLVERGLIDRRGPYGRPFDDLKTASKQAAKASTKNQTRPWTDEEVVQLYEAAKSGRTPQVVDMIVMGMFTGARIESLYRIRKRDVDLEAATVLIGAEGDKTEAGQDRLIPIAKLLLPTMERLVTRTDAPEDYLLRFRGKGDKRSDPDGKRFGRLKERLFPGVGRSATFHSFRKTFITKLGNEVGAPEHVIRDIVGHDNTKNVTMGLYRARMSPEDMRPYVDPLVYVGWEP